MLLGVSFGQLWRAERRLPPGPARQRLRAFEWAFGIGYLGSLDYLAAYGIPVYPAGYLAVLGFLIVSAWGIRRYRLVDITPSFAAGQILATMADALLVLDREGVVRVVNQAACRLLEGAEEELIGASLAQVRGGLLSSSDLERLFQTGAVPWGQTLTYRSRRHGPMALWLSASVIQDRDHRPLAAVCIVRDVTTQRQAEQQLRRTHEALLQREGALREALSALEQSHAELKAAQWQLVEAEKMESIGRLAAGVAHEVKNPLAVLLMGTQLMAKHLPDHDGRAAEILREMETAVRRADTVVRGLLDVSASRGVALQEASLNVIIQQALALVHPLSAAARITVRTELGELPGLRLDRQRMEQVLVNLFMNAIQAMPRGGTLAVTTAAAPGGSVIAEVRDTGAGIPEAALAKVFDPFFTTKPPGQGTGLGLTVCRHLVELHGGTIQIMNRPGGGCSVTLQLPVGRGGGESHDEAAHPDRG